MANLDTTAINLIEYLPDIYKEKDRFEHLEDFLRPMSIKSEEIRKSIRNWAPEFDVEDCNDSNLNHLGNLYGYRPRTSVPNLEGKRRKIRYVMDLWERKGTARAYYLAGIEIDIPTYNLTDNRYTVLSLSHRGRLSTVDEAYLQDNIFHHEGVLILDQVLTTYSMSLSTDGWDTVATILRGDVITLDGVFAVNPVSKATLDFLQPFVITADVTANANTAVDTPIVISPPIITSGPYQMVSAAPADDATIVNLGDASTAYPQNLVFHKNAFALVTVPLEMPDSVTWKARQTHRGTSVRLVKDYDIDNDQEIIRCDILYGVKAIYPELAARLSGAP